MSRDEYQIKKLYDEGKYAEVLEFYRTEERADAFTDWEYVFIQKSAYKLKDYSLCLDVYKKHLGVYPESDKLNNYMGWSLYYLLKNQELTAENAELFFRRLRYVLDRTSYAQYSPYWMVLQIYLKAVEAPQNVLSITPQEVCDYLKKSIRLNSPRRSRVQR